MTEAEWIDATDPRPMLEFMRKNASLRKPRLFAVACCRSISPLILQSQYGCRGLLIAEQMADGLPVGEELDLILDRLWYDGFKWIDGYREEKENNVIYHAASAALNCVEQDSPIEGPHIVCFNVACAIIHQKRRDDADPANYDHADRALAGLVPFLRDVFGNPFRPASVVSSWLTPTVASIAQDTYRERKLPSGELDPDRLAVLADALEDAGCTETAILDHLRGPGPHVRGCWPLDLLLGKK